MPNRFVGTGEYWEQRYHKGGNSGGGSYGKHADFKSRVLNDFVDQHNIQSVIEFGCGDGNQLSLADYPTYVGVDISPTAIEICKSKFGTDPTKSFITLDEYNQDRTFDLSLSLDVLYHLIEDEIYYQYLDNLFGASSKFVSIFARDEDDPIDKWAPHVRCRKFSTDIQIRYNDFALVKHVPNEFPLTEQTPDGSFADFYFYEKAR